MYRIVGSVKRWSGLADLFRDLRTTYEFGHPRLSIVHSHQQGACGTELEPMGSESGFHSRENTRHQKTFNEDRGNVLKVN